MQGFYAWSLSSVITHRHVTRTSLLRLLIVNCYSHLASGLSSYISKCIIGCYPGDGRPRTRRYESTAQHIANSLNAIDYKVSWSRRSQIWNEPIINRYRTYNGPLFHLSDSRCQGRPVNCSGPIKIWISGPPKLSGIIILSPLKSSTFCLRATWESMSPARLRRICYF